MSESGIDITTAQRKLILDLLGKYLPNTSAWAYGSRVTWKARPQSDLDMVVFATPEQAHAVAKLKEAFEESDLPFRVDLFAWHEVPEQFQKNIMADDTDDITTIIHTDMVIRIGVIFTQSIHLHSVLLRKEETSRKKSMKKQEKRCFL